MVVLEQSKKESLISLSSWAGSRFDWVQAAGGNTSIKLSGGAMWVKASGIHVSDIGGPNGMVLVDCQRLVSAMTETGTRPSWKTRAQEKQILEDSVLGTTSVKPSIETFMHAFLGTVVLHIHPIMLNILTCQRQWETQISALLPEAVLVPYVTPGMPLAAAIAANVVGREKEPLVIVLQNHGLVVSGPTLAWVQQKTREISDLLSEATGFCDDRCVQDLWNVANALMPTMIWAARDRHILQSLHQTEIWECPAFLPDLAVFGADHVVRVSEDFSTLQTYWETYACLPKIVLFQDRILFFAATLQQARQMEDVLSSKVILLNQIPFQELVLLDPVEVSHLLGWDAETYRQKIGGI